TANMAITSQTAPVRISSTLSAAAQRSLTIDARAADVTLAEDSFLSGQNGIEVLADGNNGLVGERNLSLTSDGLIRLAHDNQPGTAPTIIATDLLISSSDNILGETGTLVEARRDLFVQSFSESVTFDKVIAGDDIEIIGGAGNDTLNPIDAVTLAEARATGLGTDTEGDGSNIRISASDQVNTGVLEAVDRIAIRATGGSLPLAGVIDGDGKLTAGAEISLYAKAGITGTSQLFAPVVSLGGRSITLDEVNSQTTLRTVNEFGVITSASSLETFAGVSIGTLTLRDAGGTLLDATISSFDIDVGTANAANINFAGNGTVRLDNAPGALAVSLLGGLVRSSGTISALSVEMSGTNIEFGTITPLAGALAADGGAVRMTAGDGSITGGDIRNFAATGGIISLEAADNVTVGDVNGQWIEVLAGGEVTTGVLTSSTATPNFIRAGNDIVIADTALSGALELTSANGNVTATRLTSAPPVTIDAAGTVTIGEQTGGNLTAIGSDIIGLGPMSNGTGGIIDLTSRDSNITLDTLSTGTLTINSAADLIHGSLLAHGTGTINAAGAGTGGAITSTTGSLDIGFGSSSSVTAVTAALDIDMTVTGDLAFDEITAGRTLNLTIADAGTGNLAATNGGRLRGGQGATINAGTLDAGAVQGGTGSLLVDTGGFFNAASVSADIDVTLDIGGAVAVSGASSAGDDFRVSPLGSATFGAITASGGPDTENDGHRIVISTLNAISTGDLLADQTTGLQQGHVLIDSGESSVSVGAVTARTDIGIYAGSTLETGALTARDDIRAGSGGNASFGLLSLLDGGTDTEADGANIVLFSDGTLSLGGALVALSGGLPLAGATLIEAEGAITVTGSVTRRQVQTELRSITGAITVNAPVFGSSLLDAAGNISVTTTSPAAQLHGAITSGGSVLLDSAGAIDVTGTITLANDFTLASVGNASFAEVVAGDDIRMTVGGTLNTGSLLTTTAGTDNEADGRNIVISGNLVRTGPVTFTSAGAITVSGS
ncbi:MAG TPA: hypothetical protein PKE25_11035, partial [Novosphingobium sp.]|nr:hypothetical protein [Novosphingobium sp.]